MVSMTFLRKSQLERSFSGYLLITGSRRLSLKVYVTFFDIDLLYRKIHERHYKLLVPDVAKIFMLQINQNKIAF